MGPNLRQLLAEYDRALDHTWSLVHDLTPEEVAWRPDAASSAIGWHLGHQPAVAHFMVRNLTAAEPPIDAELDALMDSATPEADRGDLPPIDRIVGYRDAVAGRVRAIIGRIDAGDVGAPDQLRFVAGTLMLALVNHEYQHSRWIGEVRVEAHGKALPPAPVSQWLTTIDGYPVIGAG